MIMMIIITKIETIIMIIIIMKWARYPQSVLIHPYNIHIKKNMASFTSSTPILIN